MFEVICDSLLNGPFKWIPLPFESSSKFWLLQQFGCSKQSRTQVMKAGGLPADLQTRRTELHTEKLLVENLGNALQCHCHRWRRILPLSSSSPASPTLSFTAGCASSLSPHIPNPLPHSSVKPRGARADHIHYIFFGRSLTARKDSWQPRCHHDHQ